MPAAEEVCCQRDSDEAPVKGHATIPQGQNISWMTHIMAKVVKKDIAEPAAKNNPDHGPESKVAHLRGGAGRTLFLDQLQHIKPGHSPASKIGQRVPTNRYWAETDNVR